MSGRRQTRAAPPPEAVGPHPLGGLALVLAGERVVCRPSGALWLETHGALIVADLHLEKGSFYATHGQMLPPYDTAETLRRLDAEVSALAPDAVVFLGDSFHDREGDGRLAAADAATLRATVSGRTLVWVTGNHDPIGPRGLPGDTAPILALGALRLVHEPAGGPSAGEVAGHLHPCARVAARGASVRRRCFVTDGERVVLPAFGTLAGGLNIRDAAFHPLFRARPLAAVLGAGRVHAVGWGSLRDD
ncbi:MAG: phosphoesterase [Caulobacteraceae bacterium]|nr:phosphoesterase [Caulobacteraceae bacterium]